MKTRVIIAAAAVHFCVAAACAVAEDHDSHQVRIKIVPRNCLTAAAVQPESLGPNISRLDYLFSSPAVKITLAPEGGAASVLFRVCRRQGASSFEFSGPDRPFRIERSRVVLTATDT